MPFMEKVYTNTKLRKQWAVIIVFLTCQTRDEVIGAERFSKKARGICSWLKLILSNVSCLFQQLLFDCFAFYCFRKAELSTLFLSCVYFALAFEGLARSNESPSPEFTVFGNGTEGLISWSPLFCCRFSLFFSAFCTIVSWNLVLTSTKVSNQWG